MVAGWGAFLDSSVGRESACNIGDHGSIPGSGRSPGGRHINPLQYSCLENAMERGTWWATVHRVTKRLDETEVTEHAHMQRTIGFRDSEFGVGKCYS